MVKNRRNNSGNRNARCEIAMMGKTVNANNNDEAVLMTDYILKTLGVTDLVSTEVLRSVHNSGYVVKHIVCNTIQGMRCITYLLETEELPKPFEEDYGSGYPCAFCYVANLDAPEFSEYGDCFFELREDNFYHRVS